MQPLLSLDQEELRELPVEEASLLDNRIVALGTLDKLQAWQVAPNSPFGEFGADFIVYREHRGKKGGSYEYF
jgi:hypothetical protein